MLIIEIDFMINKKCFMIGYVNDLNEFHDQWKLVLRLNIKMSFKISEISLKGFYDIHGFYDINMFYDINGCHDWI